LASIVSASEIYKGRRDASQAIVVNREGAMVKMKVRKVTDGDTFITQDDTKVHLANVRAPEKGQWGAPQARRDFRELISRKQGKVETVARDPYGRVVAQVKVGNKSVDKAMRAKGWKDRGK